MKIYLKIAAAATYFLAAACYSQTLTLQASAEKEVPRNERVMRFFVEKTGKALDELNKNVTLDIRRAQKATYPGVQFVNAGISTNPVYDKSGRTDLWTVRATVELRSLDKQAVANSASSLAQFMAYESVRFELNQKELELARTELISEVSASFKERARLTAEALGYPRYEIAEVTLDVPISDVPRPYPNLARAKVATFDNAVPLADAIAEGGKERVSTVMRGSVALKR